MHLSVNSGWCSLFSVSKTLLHWLRPQAAVLNIRAQRLPSPRNVYRSSYDIRIALRLYGSRLSVRQAQDPAPVEGPPRRRAACKQAAPLQGLESESYMELFSEKGRVPRRRGRASGASGGGTGPG